MGGGDEPVTPEETPEEDTPTPEETPETGQQEEEKDDETVEDVEWEDILEVEQEARKHAYRIIDQSKDTWEEAVINPTDEKYLENPDLLLEDDPNAPNEWIDLYGEERHGVYTFTHGGDKFDLNHFENLNDINDIVRDAITFYIHYDDTLRGLGSHPSGAANHAAAFAEDIIHKIHPDQEVNVFGMNTDGHGFNYFINKNNDNKGYEIRINDTTSNRRGNITERPLSDRSGIDIIMEGSGTSRPIISSLNPGNRHSNHLEYGYSSSVSEEIGEDVLDDMESGYISEDVYWRIRPALGVMAHRIIESDIESSYVFIDGDGIDSVPLYEPHSGDFDGYYEEVSNMLVKTEDRDIYNEATGGQR